jgi:hypothetical protein
MSNLIEDIIDIVKDAEPIVEDVIVPLVKDIFGGEKKVTTEDKPSTTPKSADASSEPAA